MYDKLIIGGVLSGLALSTAVASDVSGQVTSVNGVISTISAIEIALAEVPGNVVETELEREDGKQIYEIEILTADGAEMEVEIDAHTGAVLEIEAEDAD